MRLVVARYPQLIFRSKVKVTGTLGSTGIVTHNFKRNKPRFLKLGGDIAPHS
jgi:hypothetical protein